MRFLYTPVNKRKSKQDENLQNPLRNKAKNKRGARKYPLRENTLNHPILGSGWSYVILHNVTLWAASFTKWRAPIDSHYNFPVRIATPIIL